MDELETLRQDNHKLNLKLESQRQSWTTELDFLKEELLLKDSKHKEQLDRLTVEARNKETAFKERISSLNDDLIASREESDKLREQIESLKASLDHLKSVRNNESMLRRSNGPISVDHFEALQESLAEKDQALALTNETITSQSERLRESNDLIDSQKQRIAQILEELETKQNTILEQQERIRQVEIERNEQEKEREQRVLEKCDSKAKGNSLFFEVDERRVKVETEMKRLRECVARLSKENIELQETVDRGDSRHTAVSNQLELIQKSEQQIIQELRKLKTESLNLFDTYRERMESLRNEYHKKLLQYRGDDVFQSDLETLRGERDELILTKISIDRELFETKKDLKYTKHQKIECETHLKILRLKMQEQQEPKPTNGSDSKKEGEVVAAEEIKTDVEEIVIKEEIKDCATQ